MTGVKASPSTGFGQWPVAKLYHRDCVCHDSDPRSSLALTEGFDVRRFHLLI